MKYFLSVLLLVITVNLFGSGMGALYEKMRLTSTFDRYLNGEMPVQLTQSYAEIKYEYLGNGLVIIDMYNNDPRAGRNDRHYRYLSYNEYYNDNIISQNKINEFIQIMEITPTGPYVTDNTFNVIESYDENLSATSNINRYNITVESRYSEFHNGQNSTLIQLAILYFDNETKRLVDLQYSRINYPVIQYYIEESYDRVNLTTYNLVYEYDNIGRLENVYRIYNNEKYLIKKYFYDGTMRVFDRPYFNDIESPGLEEIIIYDNQTLKFHLKLFYAPHHYRTPETVEIRNNSYYYVIFEYDENKNEIRQTKYYSNDTIIINSDIISIDAFGNWIRMRVHTDRREPLSGLITTDWQANREITYR